MIHAGCAQIWPKLFALDQGKPGAGDGRVRRGRKKGAVEEGGLTGPLCRQHPGGGRIAASAGQGIEHSRAEVAYDES